MSIFASLSEGLISTCRKSSTVGVRFILGKHVPNDCREFTHHGHAGYAAATPAFDTFEPLLQLLVDSEDFVSHLSQQPASHTTAGLGDAMMQALGKKQAA